MTGACHDYLAIYTSPQATSPATFCGELTDYPIDQRQLQSSGNWLLVEFYSDHLIEGRGFHLEYTTVLSCSNQTYRTQTGSFSSLNYPQNYLNKQYCIYTIDLQDSNFIIELTFKHLHLAASEMGPLQGEKCQRDYVEVYTGNVTSRYCGDWTGEYELHFLSVDDVLEIAFVSDGELTASGFQVEWKSHLSNSSQVNYILCI